MNNISTIGDIVRNKFMVQATTTDIQATEQFQLPRFWEERANIKDKAIIQQAVLKINLAENAGAATEASAAANRTSSVASSSAAAGKYESAPPSNINDSIHKPAQAASADDNTVIELEKLERENSQL